ncbi:hypothetical protein SAMN06296241_2666 [Salinimicrobium sediminis]|uniref:Uncharacterized protein n=1 Tax=Salinimicrobium sediminis TaxID=1343891 RepID=A0A285X8H8_9FLAO|nr:hypothetical protein [Salinimicrobium sediminis]SOC81094.1 hypothetical protein SAMN06296241_2666 [Salinimicrobium sediminis]
MAFTINLLTYRIKRSQNDYILHRATITNPCFEIFEALPFPCLLLEPVQGEWSREELVQLIRSSADEVDKIIGNIIKKNRKH